MEIRDVAAAYASIVSTISLGWNVYLEYVKKERQRKALAGSLMAELNALEEVYRKVELNKWEGENTEYNLVNIQEDYLKIFNSNCDKVGFFDNHDATIIVRTYIFLKGYIDTLRLLSEEWRKYHDRVKTIQLGECTQQKYQALKAQFGYIEHLYGIAYKEQFTFYIVLDEIKPTLQKHLYCQSNFEKAQGKLLHYPKKMYSYFR